MAISEALEVLGRAHKSDTLEYFNAKPLVNLLELVVSLDDGDQLFYKILEIFKAKGYQVGGRCQGVLIHEYLAKGRLADAKTAVERILKETENQRILPPIYRDLIRTGDSAKIQHCKRWSYCIN